MQLNRIIVSSHIYFKLFVSIKIKNKHITNNCDVNTRDSTYIMLYKRQIDYT